MPEPKLKLWFYPEEVIMRSEGDNTITITLKYKSYTDAKQEYNGHAPFFRRFHREDGVGLLVYPQDLK